MPRSGCSALHGVNPIKKKKKKKTLKLIYCLVLQFDLILQMQDLINEHLWP